MDKEGCLDFLDLAEDQLEKSKARKPAETNDETESAKEWGESLSELEELIERIKGQVEEADNCSKLIKGLAELAVDAAFGNNDSRSRQ